MIASLALCACSPADNASPPSTSTSLDEQYHGGSGDSTLNQPVGLALEINNGSPLSFTLRTNQLYYLNQIDMRVTVDTSTDEGVSGLSKSGDFANLNWNGVGYVEQEFGQLASAAGKYSRSRFYRGAAWMQQPSVFILEQIDGQGHTLCAPIVANIGQDGRQSPSDHFYVRRLRAIQWTFDCVSRSSCAGASQYQEEALVELRNALEQSPTFRLDPRATALRLRWSAKANAAYVIPITQAAALPYDYGFNIGLELLTPPGPGGYYQAGQDIQVRTTLRDRAGNRLHPLGSMPSYNDVVFGPNPSGIQYYRGFFDTAWVYWRRKHRERTMIAHIMGPLQQVQAIRSIIPLPEIVGQDVQEVGKLARDGVFAEWKVFPTTNDVFGGAFDPNHAGWSNPGTDTWTYHLPDDAVPGTYRITMKGRRTYDGEDIAHTSFLELQVGTTTQTEVTIHTGNCETCHNGGGSLSKVLHTNPNRGTCFACHAPLAVEYDSLISSRVHFVHSRSNRVAANVQNCSTCHLTVQSIQRTSKSACMACHTAADWPADHLTNYGPVNSIFYGSDVDGFQQCTSICHTNHPGSGLSG